MHPVLIVGNLRSRKRKMLWPRARAQLVNNSFETRTGRGVFWPTHIESSRLSSRTYHQTSGCGAVNLFFVLRTASFDCASGGLLSTPSASLDFPSCCRNNFIFHRLADAIICIPLGDPSMTNLYVGRSSWQFSTLSWPHLAGAARGGTRCSTFAMHPISGQEEISRPFKPCQDFKRKAAAIKTK